MITRILQGWLAFGLLLSSLQAAELEILVREMGTGDPVSGATVMLLQAEEMAESDKDGRVHFKDVQYPDTLKILAPGYLLHQEPVAAGKPRREIYLDLPLTEGEGMKVTIDRVPQTVSKFTLSREELRGAPGTGGDPLKVIRSLPGVVVGGPGGGQLYVRGSGDGDSAVWADRQQLSYLFHWADILGFNSTINRSLVQDFNAFLGGFPVEYPDRLGAMLDVQTRPPKNKRLYQTYRVATNEAALLLEGPLDKPGGRESGYISARQSYLDWIVSSKTLNEAADSEDISIVLVPRYYDYQGAWRQELDDGHVAVQLFAAGDELEIDIKQAKTDPDLVGRLGVRQDYRSVGANWQRRLGQGWSSIGAIYVLRDKTYQTLGTDGAGQPLFLDIVSDNVVLQPELRRESASGQTAMGIQLVRGTSPVDVYITRQPSETDPNFNLTREEKYRLKEVFKGTGLAPYVKQRVNFGPWTTEAGLRYSHLQISDGIDMRAWSPRGMLEYRFHGRLSAHGSWGLYHQQPRPADMVKTFGNPRLGYQRAEHRIVGLKHQPRDNWYILAEAYDKRLSKLVVQVEDADPPDNYFNRGRGRAWGFDLLVRREYAARRMGWMSYSYGHSRRENTITGERYAFNGDQRHTLSLVWRQPMWGGWRKWDWGFRLHAHSGQPYTPVVGRTKFCRDENDVCSDQNRIVDRQDVFWQPVYADFNSGRLPWGYQLDFRIDREIRYPKATTTFYVDLQNVTFAANVLGYDYGDEYEKVDNPDEATSIPFVLPFIGVEVTF